MSADDLHDAVVHALQESREVAQFANQQQWREAVVAAQDAGC
jgi:hypothetical protein